MKSLFHKYLERAHEELRRGHLEQAEEALNSALFMKPNHPDVICCEIELFRAEGRYEDAVRRLTEALEIHPYHPGWVLELAEILINRLQEPVLALDWLERLMRCCGEKLSPSQKLRAFQLKAEALIDQERLYEASRSLREALWFFPLDLNLLFLSGWVSLHRSNFYAAASFFHRILRRDSSHSDAHYYLGLVFAALGEMRLMQCHFEQALQIDGEDDSPPRFALGDFQRIAVAALEDELFDELPDCRVRVEPYPSLSMLELSGMDPRRVGVLMPAFQDPARPHCSDQLVLVLFQRNIERFCCTETDVYNEVQQFALQELERYVRYHPPFKEERRSAATAASSSS